MEIPENTKSHDFAAMATMQRYDSQGFPSQFLRRYLNELMPNNQSANTIYLTSINESNSTSQ